MPKNIVMLLAVPRSGSTVTEILFCGSGHFTHCLHEPNADHYYKDKDLTKTDKSKFKYSSYQQFKDEVLEKAKQGRVFIKDMVHHFYNDIAQDREFAEQIQFVLLIRHPISAICSHMTANSEVTSEEIGFNKLYLFSLLLSSWDQDYRVVSYEQILENQSQIFRALFGYLGLEFREEMLTLEPTETLRAQMEKFGPWHVKALNSLKIQAQEPTYTVDESHPRVQELLLNHYDSYLNLKTDSNQLLSLALGRPYHTLWQGGEGASDPLPSEESSPQSTLSLT